MSLIKKIQNFTESVSVGMNWLSAVSVSIMMLLTCADILLRYFRHPIPGAYEIVSYLGALTVSFSLSHTSIGRGHIAVDFFFMRLSEKNQYRLEMLNTLICICLFACISWQTILFGNASRHSGEVSMTLQIPVYPFIYGVATGCSLLTVVFSLRLLFQIIHRGKTVI